MSESESVNVNVSESKKENVVNNTKNVVSNPENVEDKNVTNKINLLEIEITNENTALNVLIGFLNIAQKRGAFAINESSKIHECIKMFIKK